MAFEGLNRLTALLPQSGADIVILDEGNSDAYDGVTVTDYRSALESAVGAIESSGKVTILMNQYPTCCAAGGFQSQLDAVNGVMGQVAAEHGVRLADLDRAWRSTCDQVPDCNLLASDGLHPNSQGYDVITQVLLGSLAGIDIFSPQGAAQVEEAYSLPPGSVIVKPDE
jgi:lysophospholipase L1-like esterase